MYNDSTSDKCPQALGNQKKPMSHIKVRLLWLFID